MKEGSNCLILQRQSLSVVFFLPSFPCFTLQPNRSEPRLAMASRVIPLVRHSSDQGTSSHSGCQFRTTTSVRTEVGVMDMRKDIRSLEDLKPTTIALLKQSHLEKISLPNLKVPPSTAADLNSSKYAHWQYAIRLGTTNLRSWRYLTAKVNRPLSILRTRRRL